VVFIDHGVAKIVSMSRADTSGVTPNQHHCILNGDVRKLGNGTNTSFTSSIPAWQPPLGTAHDDDGRFYNALLSSARH
jgi:hypothetical protein